MSVGVAGIVHAPVTVYMQYCMLSGCPWVCAFWSTPMYRKESARILPHMCPCERRSRIKPYMRSCAGNKVAVKPKTIPMAGSVDSRTCKIHLCNSTRLVPGQGEICWCNSAPPESRRNGSGRTRVIGVFEGVVCPFAVVLRSLGAALMREITS